jgi:hypothetical protein
MSCPTPTKRSFATIEHALRRLSEISAWHAARQTGERVPTRAYACRCGGFHLTSQAKNGPIRKD